MDGGVWNVLADLRSGAGLRRPAVDLRRELCAEMWRAIRYGREMSVVLIGAELSLATPGYESDEARDEVFEALEHWSTLSIRLSDQFGRMGGGAYGFVLAETDEHSARCAAKRIVRDSKIAEVAAHRSRALSSVWVGAAAIDGVETVESLLARARSNAVPCASLAR